MQGSIVEILPRGRKSALQDLDGIGSASQVYVNEKSSVQNLKKALENHLSVQVLAFTDADKIFGGFTDKEWAQSAGRRIARLSGVWCCGKGSSSWLAYGMDSSLERLESSDRKV